MSLAALTGMNLIRVGAANRNGEPSPVAGTQTLIDAAKEACIMYGQIYWADGASHTVDTSGSSKFEWRTGNVTNANAATRVKAGIASLDTSTGPPARAVNVADVITFNVSVTHSGGGGTIAANAWQSNTPDSGTDTVAHGAFRALAVQMTVLGGADVVNVTTMVSPAAVSPAMPGVTAFTGGSYANATKIPNCIITASDGTKGYFYQSYIATTGLTTQTWNSGSAQVEYGNFVQFDVPVKAYGIYSGASIANDCDFVLYSAPTGTPVAMATVSVDANAIAGSTVGGESVLLFTSPQSLSAGTLYFVAAKPGASNVQLQYKTFNAAADANSEFLGTNCYAGSRPSGGGAFSAQNSNKDRFAIGLLVGAFDTGGYPASRVMLGM